MLPPERIADRFPGRPGGRQREKGPQRRHSLLPEAVDQFEFGERKHVSGQGTVLLQRGGLVRREKPALKQPGSGGTVNGQGMVPERLKFFQEPFIEFFRASRPGEVEGCPQDIIRLGSGRQECQQ